MFNDSKLETMLVLERMLTHAGSVNIVTKDKKLIVQKVKFLLSMALIMMALLQKEATPVTLSFTRGYNHILFPFHTLKNEGLMS